jgi:Mg2+-importing ATPase
MMNKPIDHYSSCQLSDLFEEFQTGTDGLSTEKAQSHLENYGHNSFEIIKKSPIIIEWLQAFLTPLPVVLITLCIVSFWIGETRGAIVIGLMIFLSTTFAFFQEYRSTKAAEKLKALVSVRTTVIRDYQSIDIPLHDVVPGDIVTLSAGDMIPADLRLIDAKDLFINQSALSGESIPVEKTLSYEKDSKSIFEIDNLCFMGSYVSSGVGKGIVFGTAMHTIFGDLTKNITTQTKKTSFDKGIEKFIWLMIKFMLVLVPLVFLANGLVKGNWLEALLFATAVAVGLTPEMLPLLVTINLAKGAINMAKKKVIVKKLNSIQNLGAMDILCTDKTGTLTQNEIILEKHINTTSEDDDEVLKWAYLNSYYQSGLKNLMDEAVLKHEIKHQHLHFPDKHKKIDEIPFDFERRRMSVILEDDQQYLLICKGAFEEVLKQCSKIKINGSEQAISEDIRISQQSIINSLNEDGFRVVAVAIKNICPTHIFLQSMNQI